MRLFAATIIAISLIAGSLHAGEAKRTTAPGSDDLSRYVATKVIPGGQTTLRDSAGRTLGTASTTATRTTFRDSSGLMTGTAAIEGSRTVFRDASGRTVWTATPTGSQTTTYRDASGRTLGTASRTGTDRDDLPRCRWPHDRHGAAHRIKRNDTGRERADVGKDLYHWRKTSSHRQTSRPLNVG